MERELTVNRENPEKSGIVLRKRKSFFGTATTITQTKIQNCFSN